MKNDYTIKKKKNGNYAVYDKELCFEIALFNNYNDAYEEMLNLELSGNEYGEDYDDIYDIFDIRY